MRNLNEQIDRIKNLMSINEVCDLSQCEKDLEDADYKVFSPAELSLSCEENNIIKCVVDVLDTIGASGTYSTGSVGDSINDCYVLVNGNKIQTGQSLFHFSFYASGQVVISMKLGNSNKGDKLIYRGKFECTGTDLKIYGGRNFKYIGFKSSGTLSVTDKSFLDSSGGEQTVSSSQMAALDIRSPLKYSDVMTYYLNVVSPVLTNKNVLGKGLTTNEIKKIINH